MKGDISSDDSEIVAPSSKKERSETRYIRQFCQVPLHKSECFTKYHTRKKY